MVLDFSTVSEPGERTFTIDRSNTNLPRGVELVRIFHHNCALLSSVALSRGSHSPQTSGGLPEGLRIERWCESAALAITGPQSKVGSVTVLHTDPVDLNNISEDKNVRVTAYLPTLS